MSQDFDPYRKWLGIPPEDQPPHHYRLLGIAPLEDDPDVIDNAATRQMAHVRTFQTGKHSQLSQKLLNELAAARRCLLEPAKKAQYDEQLRAHLAAASSRSPVPPTPEPALPPPPAAHPPLASRSAPAASPAAEAPSPPSVRPGRPRTRAATAVRRARMRRKSPPWLLLLAIIGVTLLVGALIVVAHWNSM